jgi:D-xylose transport system ATP-binding protein
MSDQAFLSIDRIGKAFAGVQALDDVSFSVGRGEIHAVMGENGAGKSTLMKILAGVYPAGSFAGGFSVDGAPCRFADVRAAEAAGIVMIPQELAVVGELSVAENMFLNAWPGRGGLVDWARLHDDARRNIERLGLKVPFAAPMKSLSAAQQQMVLIAKALSKDVRILVLDEPTSSLSSAETETLFDRLRALKAQGITALYISHKIEEVMAISDRVTVLRDGRFVGTRPTSGLNPSELVSMMVGRPISQMYPRVARTPGPPVLSVRGLSSFDAAQPDRAVLSGVDLDIHAGEIVGLYGLVGAGRTELLTALFGAWPGRVTFDRYDVRGEAAVPRSPKAMMARGLGFLTEDRKKTGIVPEKSIGMNLTLASLSKISHLSLLDSALEYRRTQGYVRDLAIKTPSVATDIGNLSGGNQQKVLLGRWLSADSSVLLLDDPTRGVDVGAKVEIFHLLNRFAGEGKGVLFVSSELPEVLGVADRILVMHEGRLVANLAHAAATQEIVMEHAAGRGGRSNG